MTTLFWGDINFPSSRAVDDYEDESEEEKEIQFTVDMNSHHQNIFKSIHAKRFIFAIGSNAIAFTKAYILQKFKHEKIGSLSMHVKHFKEDKNNTNNTFVGRDCFLYHINEGYSTIICHFDSNLNTEFQQDFVKYMFGLLGQNTPPLFIILTNVHISNLKIDKIPIPNPPCLRFLKTDVNEKDEKKFNCIPYLEQPNIISGMPASIMTYCQIHKLTGYLYLVYSETFITDIVTVNAFLSVLNTQELKDFITINGENIKTQKYLENIIQSKTNTSLFI
ncbi:proteasome assembly chaperone 1-like isoform X1 [Gordionus sp. m RMFG-2023]|uniref:proteasome assembly chaperone 1-like isoform X1 n=1 Tax=Gordionus sp. m RMFG-2023 TaxID=3053472 RepID=UPI0031FC844E